MSLKRLVFLLLFFNLFVWSGIIADYQSLGANFDFLSVGQGDAELISLDGVHVLIDGGPDGSIIRELGRAVGQKKYIDILILSHAHADHFVGLAEVIKNYNIGILLMHDEDNGSASFTNFVDFVKNNGIRIETINEGDSISFGKMKTDVLFPPYIGTDRVNDPNSDSLVTLTSYEGRTFLFTGDIGKKEEKEIVDRYDVHADVLKVAHHGSGKSSSLSFVEKVNPAISVIEAGSNNRYGFPASETLETIKNIGSKVYRTDNDGSVRIILKDDNLRVIKL